MSKQSQNNSGIGLFTLLGIVFIVLKLTEVINWSWWYVLLPLWGPLALILVIAIGYFSVIALLKNKS